MADDHRSFDVGADDRVPLGPGQDSSFDATTLDSRLSGVGYYTDYLRWLARHPSGVRYRAEIQRVLAAAVPRASDWER